MTRNLQTHETRVEERAQSVNKFACSREKSQNVTIPGPFVSISLFVAATSMLFISIQLQKDVRVRHSTLLLSLFFSIFSNPLCRARLPAAFYLTFHPLGGRQPPPVSRPTSPFAPEGGTKLPRGKGNVKRMAGAGLNRL